MWALIFTSVLCLTTLLTSVNCVNEGRKYWYEASRDALNRRLSAASASASAPTSARSVILFVGDGLGMSTLTAARILRGQRQGRTGEEEELVWEKFQAVALARTYNNDAQVGESSACATALMSGVKANYETVGMDATGVFNNCLSSLSSRVSSLMDWAQEEGKATGIVTNTRLTHATPAALYAHSASRYWEDDSKMPPTMRRSCKDIARQLVEDEPGRNVNVLLGGGRRHWVSKVTPDPVHPDREGRRLDGRNLIDDWLREKRRRGLNAQYLWTKAQMDKVDYNSIDHLLGMFAYSHMEFETDRKQKDQIEPSLAEMTVAAIKVLKNNPRGFFLFVEGGRIDHAHHYNNAFRALDETLALEDAVEAALREADLDETLVVFTADHSNVLSLGGTATDRGNPILGVDKKVSDMDSLAYSTLLYGNGPGYSFTHPRTPPGANTRDTIQASAIPRSWASHGGEDVPVFAHGPLASQLFSGSFDQSYIPHAIAYAACIGEHSSRCGLFDVSNNVPMNDAAVATPHVSCEDAVVAKSVQMANFAGQVFGVRSYYLVCFASFFLIVR